MVAASQHLVKSKIVFPKRFISNQHITLVPNNSTKNSQYPLTLILSKGWEGNKWRVTLEGGGGAPSRQ